MGGYRLRFFPTSLSFAYWFERDDRHDDHDFIRCSLAVGQTFVDVGANIGALSLDAAGIVGPSGRVVSIEPHPKTFGYLRKNIALNAAGILAVNSAVGERHGELLFSDLLTDDQNSVVEGGGIVVPVDTLDQLLKDLPGSIDLLKIDVEGYEKFVLDGAAGTLERTKMIYFEAWEEHYGKHGYCTQTIIEFLNDKGFDVFKPGSDVPLPSKYSAQTCQNLVAVRRVLSGAPCTGGMSERSPQEL